MNTKKIHIVYQSDDNNNKEIHWLWKEEAEAMCNADISVGIESCNEAKELMFRGGSHKVNEYYNKDSRYINHINHVIEYLNMSYYLKFISDLSIDTFFVDKLNDDVIEEIKRRSWDKAFIKRDTKALEHIEEGKSIWPYTSFNEMEKLYNEMNIEGKYAIRKFIEKEVIEQEERYWVLNGNIYHRDNYIPPVVKKAAIRLNKLGSRYYTIDATPEFVVEVNPGESSDRHAVNSAELFASWIKNEFGS